MKNWFQCKIRYLQQTEEGLIKRVSENYLVDAMTFTEAENRIIQELGSNLRELSMMSMTRSPITEVVFYGDTDKWHKAKISYVSSDPDTGKDKKITTYHLINANDVAETYDRIQEAMKDWLVPFAIPKIEESNIVDVIEYQPGVDSKLRKYEEPPADETYDEYGAELNAAFNGEEE